MHSKFNSRTFTLKLKNKTMGQKHLLMHAVINQVESDINEFDYDAFDELLNKLMENVANVALLIGFLSDKERELWLEDKTNQRY